MTLPSRQFSPYAAGARYGGSTHRENGQPIAEQTILELTSCIGLQQLSGLPSCKLLAV